MVVSLMTDRLSPKKAPPTTAAATTGSVIVVASAKPVAIGISATIVPTLVPIQIEVRHAAMNRPANAKLVGRMRSVRSTIAPAAPISFAVAAKAPANIKIQTISRSFGLPAPCEKIDIRSPNGIPRVKPTAIIAVITKINSSGALLTPP